MVKRDSTYVGTGITAHFKRRLVFSGAGEPGDATIATEAFRTAATVNAPWAWMEREKDIAARTLAAIEAGEHGEDGDRIFEPHDGSGWYSQEIIKCVRRIETARDKGDLESACRASAALSELTTTIRLKRSSDFDFGTGVKINDSLASRRNAANEQRSWLAQETHKPWQAEAEKIWAIRPNLTNSAVARHLKRNLKLTNPIGTIRKVIRRLAEPG